MKLVLITAALASCNQNNTPTDWENGNGGKTYLRSDSTAPYARSHYHGGGMWFYAFRPMYSYNTNGFFTRNGFSSNAIPMASNYGTNYSKSRAVRGGFGRSSKSGG
ncbi:MAG: hypothetical protein IPP48_06415 [Chitinophagaceae bacterium]|nr:hypothetical protein [Chitinophagaceae bacterium]